MLLFQHTVDIKINEIVYIISFVYVFTIRCVFYISCRCHWYWLDFKCSAATWGYGLVLDSTALEVRSIVFCVYSDGVFPSSQTGRLLVDNWPIGNHWPRSQQPRLRLG